MGVEYNKIGEECKSSKQEKERKVIWVEGVELDIHVFVCRTVFTWRYLDNNIILSVEA
jgi:hypothetical protein